MSYFICPNCGKSCKGNFCKYCGSNLHDSTSNEEQYYESSSDIEQNVSMVDSNINKSRKRYCLAGIFLVIVTIFSLYDTICYALNFYDPYILNNKVNLHLPIVQLIFFLLMLIILKKENRYFKIAFIFGILYAAFFVLKTILGVTSLHDIVFASFYFLTYSINSVLISLLYFTTYIFFIIGMLKTSFLNKIKSILIFYLVAFGVSRVLNLISRVFNDIISNPYLDETRSISRVLLLMSLFVTFVYLIAKLIFCIKIIIISKAKIRDSNQENYIDNAN